MSEMVMVRARVDLVWVDTQPWRYKPQRGITPQGEEGWTETEPHPFTCFRDLFNGLLYYCTYTSGYYYELTNKRSWEGSNALLTMKTSDGGGWAIRGKACESEWCVCDSIRKVPTVGQLRELVPEMPDGWNFPYAITHAPLTFARLPSCLRTTFTLTLFIAHCVSSS